MNARRVVLAGALGVVASVLAAVITAQAVRAALGYAPIDFNSWLIALIALIGLVSNLAMPGRKERARRLAKRAAARPSTDLGTTRRPPLRRVWRLRRPMPGLAPIPPQGG